MRKEDRTTSKTENAIRFIDAAHELIEEAGLDSVSIRRIAERAGFHNSTLYLYFHDVDELILLACVKYFEGYEEALSKMETDGLSVEERFFRIWRLFCDNAFARPDIFYHFLYGKYSDNLSAILNRYYEFRPDRVSMHSPVIREMYFGNNLRERCRKILAPLLESEHVRSAGRLNKDNLETLNEMTVFCLKGLLEKKIGNKDIPAQELTREYLSMLHILLGI